MAGQLRQRPPHREPQLTHTAHRPARLRVALLAACALLASAAGAEVELRVDARSEEIAGRAELGQVVVEGVGAVSVVAQREGKRVVLRAGGPDGTALGRAEAPVGLDRTPIFVTTPRGLEQIVVVWEGGAGEGR